MTATYRLKGVGWLAVCVIVALAFYLVSLQVAAERSRLDSVNRSIVGAQRDIRALETEFSTRSNLAQLERWNGEVLALTAPAPDQYVHSEAQLASLDFASGNGAQVEMASLVIPSLPTMAPPPDATPDPADADGNARRRDSPAGACRISGPCGGGRLRNGACRRQGEGRRDAGRRAGTGGIDRSRQDGGDGDARPQAAERFDFGRPDERRARGNGFAQVSVALARPLPPRHLTGKRHALLATSHARLMMLMLLFGAGMLLVVGRLAYLAAFTEPATSPDAAAALVPLRADLVDRNGAPLARTIDAWSIGVHPRDIIGDRHAIAQQLASLLPTHDEAWFYAKLTDDVAFTYLERRALPDVVEKVNAIGEPAIVFQREPERLYPQSTLAAHAIGFVDFSGHGGRGMERALDGQLTNPALRGRPVALSIDTRVQAAMESELGAAMVHFQAQSAAGIVLDAHTGEVITMVSLPTFNPNDIRHATPDQLRNNVTQSVYELGSTFKPITMAAALDDGVVKSLGNKFDATAPLHVGRFTIHDERSDPKRWLTVPEILIYSSNVGTARVADLMGKDRMQAIFTAMGFHDRPSIELREKARPLWPSFWARTTVMTTGFGHGIAITPLQLANAYATLVNGGIWRPTTLMKLAPGRAPQGRRVITEATSYKIRQMLRLIVLKGTGRKGDAPGYRVGGKTGTGEIASDGGYDRSRNVATFAAAFPIEAPRYVVVAMLDSPHAMPETYGWKTAAWNVAPVVGRVIQRVGPMLGVLPDMNKDIDESDLLPLLWHPPGSNSDAIVGNDN